jgi:hypothetical protein
MSREELPQKSLGCIEALQLIVAEAEHFVSPELEISVSGDHSCVLARIRRAAAVAGVVLGSVDFQDDALSVRQQQELSTEDRKRMSGLVNQAKMMFFGRRAPCSRVGTTVNTG